MSANGNSSGGGLKVPGMSKNGGSGKSNGGLSVPGMSANIMPGQTTKKAVSSTGTGVDNEGWKEGAGNCAKTDDKCIVFWKLNSKFEGTTLESYQLWLKLKPEFE